MKRRSFIQSSILVSGSLWVPRFIHKQDVPLTSSKKLVVIQLSGGNDGLNTWIPYHNDLYYQMRPELAIPRQEVLQLEDQVGLHPQMEGIRALYDQGQVLVINQVGYPNAERSHFRAMDIWHSGSQADEYWSSGWLGRYLDAACQNGKPAHQVIEMDGTLSLAVKGEEAKGLALQDTKRLYRQVRSPHIQRLVKQQESGQETLDYLYKTLRKTVESAEYVYEHTQVQRSHLAYPQHAFGKKLKQVAELISSGVETQVYYVSLSGFDTHVRQASQQARLLDQYSQAVSVFVEDLKKQQVFDETLILTFSEFGRRVAENGSRGTDHGKANTVWLIGKQLKKVGCYGEGPNFQALDEGDLAYQVDFRQIYSSIIQNWLGGNSKNILQRSFDPLPII